MCGEAVVNQNTALGYKVFVSFTIVGVPIDFVMPVTEIISEFSHHVRFLRNGQSCYNNNKMFKTRLFRITLVVFSWDS